MNLYPTHSSLSYSLLTPMERAVSLLRFQSLMHHFELCWQPGTKSYKKGRKLQLQFSVVQINMLSAAVVKVRRAGIWQAVERRKPLSCRNLS